MNEPPVGHLTVERSFILGYTNIITRAWS